MIASGCWFAVASGTFDNPGMATSVFFEVVRYFEGPRHCNGVKKSCHGQLRGSPGRAEPSLPGRSPLPPLGGGRGDAAAGRRPSVPGPRHVSTRSRTAPPRIHGLLRLGATSLLLVCKVGVDGLVTKPVRVGKAQPRRASPVPPGGAGERQTRAGEELVSVGAQAFQHARQDRALGARVRGGFL